MKMIVELEIPDDKFAEEAEESGVSTEKLKEDIKLSFQSLVEEALSFGGVASIRFE